MTRKIINQGDPGTVSLIGSDDFDYINKYLTGVDQSSVDPVAIATTTSFNNQKLRIQDSATSGKYYIFNSSAIAANRNLTLPLIASDDTLTSGTNTQTLTNKTLSLSTYIDIGDIAAPGNPSSNTGRLYARTIDTNNDGLFILLKKAGAFVEVQIA